MADVNTAASSPAEMQDPFNGQQPSLVEFQQYRETGEVPERFKPAETAEVASADAPEKTVASTETEEVETAPESDPAEDQEPPQKGSAAQKRILQLLAKQKELERRLEQVTKTDAKPESSTAQTEKEPSPEDANADGTPKFKTYEDFVKAQARWEARQEIASVLREQAQRQALQALQAKLDESRTRYKDADDVIFPAAQQIQEAHIPMAVKEVFAQSELFTDLCYVVGSDPEELQKFISLAQQNPRAALAKVFEYENGIRAELAKAEKEPEKAPEPKRTQAPKPPSPVGGSSSRAFDVSDESLSAEDWARKRNAQINKR